MIVIDLSCSAGHRFEGWFPSAAGFDAQLAAGQVICPHCASSEVRRIPSAAHLVRHGAGQHRSATLAPSSAPMPHKAPIEPNVLLTAQSHVTALKTLVETVLSRSEDVGQDFANEVRRIHYQEAPERAVHGKVSAEEYRNLREEGIDVFPIPSLGKDELN